jgi:long-chain fatty acid transport protein
MKGESMKSKNLLIPYVLLTCTLAHAGPAEDTFGASSRIKAMGGAGVALAQDYAATFYNPANLSRCGKNKATIAYDYARSDLAVRNLDGATLPSAQIGNRNSANLGACFSPLEGLGIGIYASVTAPKPMNIRLETLNGEPNFTRYGRGVNAPSIAAGVSYAFLKQVSVGIAGTFATGMYIRQDAVFPPLGTPPLKIGIEADVQPLFGMIAGITYEPFANLRGAFVYRTATFSRLELDANTVASAGVEVPLDLIMKGALDFSPQQFALGASYSPIANLTLGADLTYYLWSAYQGPFFQTQAAEGAAAAKNMTFEPYEDPGFSNVFVPRVGAEYALNPNMLLRAGYAYHMTPAPATIGRGSLLDADVHRVTLGAGYRLASISDMVVAIDAFLALDVMTQRTIMRNTVVAKEPKGYTFGGTALNSGLALTAEF